MSKFLELAVHPADLKNVLHLVYFRDHLHPHVVDALRPDLKRCYELLKQTSRSFAAVIEELHPNLRDVIMIFYVVLRALDTIEDDMSLDNAIKVPLLRSFDSKLDTTDWTFNGSAPTEKDRNVLVEFDVVLREYHRLPEKHQQIIKEYAGKMGNGMADYILDKDFSTHGIPTIAGYDLYCYYVAGLVGEGLTKMIRLEGFLDESVAQDNYKRAESMGLFLQKTNIIRDYHEDIVDGRTFWPREIWSKYTSDFSSFAKDNSSESQDKAMACVSEMVLNALDHVQDVLEYLARVTDPSTFNFCAIPQVMAIATLALVYNNPKILSQNVKLRKGVTCGLILEARNMPGVVRIFRRYAQVINHKSRVKDPNYLKVGVKCANIEKMCEFMYPAPKPAGVEATTQNPLEILVSKRASIDKKIQHSMDAETSRINLVLFAVAAVTIAVLFRFK